MEIIGIYEDEEVRGKTVVSKELEKNILHYNKHLSVDRNFDVICRRMKIGKTKACIYFLDGFIKDDIMERILTRFYSMEKAPNSEEELCEQFLPYIEVGIIEEEDEITTAILSGNVCLFVEGYERVVAIDCRTYPARGIEEPEKDRVLRGSRDGFVETISFNTALIRRRIRSPQLSMEMFQVGTYSKSEIVVCYMIDKVNESYLKMIKEKIKKINVEALSMNQESFAECLYARKWYNPFPKFKYTERPDTAAASLMEGKIILLIDNSSSAMVLPTTFFDVMDQADDYYFPPIVGTYLRFTRLLITILTLILTPLWLLLMENPQWIPPWLSFIQVKEVINVPLVLQLLIMELAIDGMRLASINTPSMLTTPLSIAAALVLGDFSVKSGWFNSETMLYMAFVAVANYTQANLELGYALKFMRYFLLIMTSLFHGWGFAIGLVVSCLSIVFNKTISGQGYLYPLIPFNKVELKKILYRYQLKNK